MSSNFKDLSGVVTEIVRDFPQSDKLLKRWGQVSPNLHEFISCVKPGDIFTDHDFRPYSPGDP